MDTHKALLVLKRREARVYNDVICNWLGGDVTADTDSRS